MTFNTKHAYKKIGRQFIDVQLKNFSKQDLINYGQTLPDESVFTLLYCKGWLTTSCKRFDSNGRLIHENSILSFFKKPFKFFMSTRIKRFIRRLSRDPE